MSKWTEAARRALDEYCARSKSVLAGGAADAEEVSEDLRRHVEEEVRAARLTVVTEDDIKRILARVGEPGNLPEPNSAAPAPPKTDAIVPDTSDRPGFALFTFAILLPLITFCFELATGASAGALFDPFPTWLHVAAVALVPVVNFCMWRAGRAGDARRMKWFGWLNSAVLGICFYYVILYLPFAPYAALGILFFGVGLLPLSPFFALIATPILRAKYIDQIQVKKLPGTFLGAFIAIALLLVVQFPTAATYYGMAKASSEDSETKAQGVRVLQLFGNRELMLRACYGLLQRSLDMDLIRNVASGNERISAEQARETYYRVTGKAFNSVPPPALFTRTGRWTALDEEFTWDEALGGDAVAQRIKGLSLSSSRMDAVAYPDSAVVYCEWTMEFKNVSSQQREARAQIGLPPGAVVSRVTLWIDGEEREAAFGGRSQVKEAYREVAVVQRRDPILVTTCGPDRILMQCFPVQPGGGVMKIKVGITAPLIMNAADHGQFVWPRFLERNFAIGSNLKHDLWIESNQRLANGKTESAPPASPDRPFALRDSLKESSLAEAINAVTVFRSPEMNDVWTPESGNAGIIHQSLHESATRPIQRLVIVVDGSQGMKSFAREIAGAMSHIPTGAKSSLILAEGGTDTAAIHHKAVASESTDEIQTRLLRANYRGGADNLPALEAAWDAASSVENGAVLWIHGPEPVLLSAESGLQQRLERNVTRTRLIELQTQTGPDRVLEKLDGLSALKRIPRLGAVSNDLARLFDQWSGKIKSFEFERERIETPSRVRVDRQIERLWARDEALRLAAEHKHDEAVTLAARNQLVTPLTGAVVLERKEQYDRHQLNPADPTTVPSVPEPGILSLLVLGAFACVISRRKRSR